MLPTTALSSTSSVSHLRCHGDRFTLNAVLLGSNDYSLTGQEHGGLLGFFQSQVLACMNNLWFDRLASSCLLSQQNDQLRRLASRDRAHVARKIKEHAADTSKPPLLVRLAYSSARRQLRHTGVPRGHVRQQRVRGHVQARCV